MGSMHPMKYKDLEMVEEIVRKQIQENPVLMYSTTMCGWCRRARSEFEKMKVTHTEVKLDEEKYGAEMAHVLVEMTKQKTVPNIFIGGRHLGGFDKLMFAVQEGTLEESLKSAKVSYDPAYFAY